MYSGKVNSPVSHLSGDITASGTTIPLDDVSVLPAAPNIATLGPDTANPETIYYPTVSGLNLVNVTREFDKDGDLGAKKAWAFGASVSRRYTHYDHEQFKSGIDTNAANLSTVSGVAATNATNLTAHSGDKSAHQSNVITITFIMGDGTNVMASGIKGYLEIPFACTLSGWTMLADLSTTTVVDVWKDTYANFPPDNGDAMPGASKEPTITASTKGQDTDIADWTSYTIAAGSVLGFYVDSNNNAKQVTLSLKAYKT